MLEKEQKTSAFTRLLNNQGFLIMKYTCIKGIVDTKYIGLTCDLTIFVVNKNKQVVGYNEK